MFFLKKMQNLWTIGEIRGKEQRTESREQSQSSTAHSPSPPVPQSLIPSP
jgi:hypothetical protein